MDLFVLGYISAAVAFYVLIVKTAKMEPEVLAVSNPSIPMGVGLMEANSTEMGGQESGPIDRRAA